MVSELVLHVGFRKTGTSSIQRGLTKVHAEHPELDFAYAKTGLMPAWPFAHHSFVARMVAGDHKVLDELAAEIATSSASRLVMSCEGVTRPECGWILDKVRERLPDLPIKAVVFVRDHDLWLESYYAEEVRRGRCTSSIMTFYQASTALLRFTDRIKRIEASLGPSAAVVRLFNSDTLMRDAFRAILGHDGDYGYRFWENNSLSAASTLAIRQVYQRFPVNDQQDIDVIVGNLYRIEHASNNKDNKSYLTPEQRAVIFNDCRLDTMSLSQDYLNMSAPFWSPDRPDKSPSNEPFPLEAYLFKLLKCDLKGLAHI